MSLRELVMAIFILCGLGAAAAFATRCDSMLGPYAKSAKSQNLLPEREACPSPREAGSGIGDKYVNALVAPMFDGTLAPQLARDWTQKGPGVVELRLRSKPDLTPASVAARLEPYAGKSAIAKVVPLARQNAVRVEYVGNCGSLLFLLSSFNVRGPHSQPFVPDHEGTKPR